jgi:guanosine-3',5'-bis(diphosphate) 3'-pyrophosphohydrolase
LQEIGTIGINKSDKIIPIDEELKLDTLVFGANDEKLNYTYSKCCSPIPGDEVFGFTTIKDGIKIHRQDCPNAIRLQSNFAYRILETKWIDSSHRKSIAMIHIKGIDSMGFINDVTQILSNNLKVNIQSMNISSSDGIFDGMITILINDKKNLAAIIENIKKVKGITSVSRKFKST